MVDFINRRDLDFLLFEMLRVEQLAAHERFADHDRSSLAAMLDTAQNIASNKFATHAVQSDCEEPVVQNGRVHIIAPVGEALRAYYEAGFGAASFDASVGGMQLPWTALQACNALFNAANISTYAYALLTGAAANLLAAFGSPAQRAQYLPPMLDGRYFGTMCLSEPQAGSSLADIRTRATPTETGHYLLKGSKMWISGGEHELCENIVHMVLAKIPGGPAGVNGISLFLVPRFRLAGPARGQAGQGAVATAAESERCFNDVRLVGLNHKMGYRGTVNTLLAFGDDDDCHGYLIGEPHQGLRYMFQMMNEARVAVGLGATMLGYAGYRYSLEYARGRAQGRPLQNKRSADEPVAIIEHPDIRRLLMEQKTFVEGALALNLYCARLIDERAVTQESSRRADLDVLLEVLTPIAKSWPSEFCLQANKHAIQVLGGYGYTRDHPLERLYRDNRLNAIHEGTHGIQALDLLGRKMRLDDSRGLKLLSQRLLQCVAACREVPALAEHSAQLAKANEVLTATTLALLRCNDLARAMSHAGPYLDATGHVVIAWMWLEQACVAHAGLASAARGDSEFYTGKLLACRYFYRHLLPSAVQQLEQLRELDATLLEMPESGF